MAALPPPSAKPIKALYIGDSGAGKTGSLISLARAGYNLRIADFDAGGEIISQMLYGEKEAWDRVDIETCTDDYEFSPVFGIAAKRGTATAPAGFAKGMKVLTDWPKLGKPTTWGIRDIVVVDSLTKLGKCAMNHVMALNNKLGQQPSQPNWGQAMDLQENVCALLFSDSIQCNVIVTAHITFVAPEGEAVPKAYPSALGNKLPPKIGQYFNSTLYVRKEGKLRFIYTNDVGLIACKTPAPDKVKEKYPIATGLADYFRDLHGPLPDLTPQG